MKIIFSRKGYDDQYGGKPSIILPNNEMLSFPIPVNYPEKGISSQEIFFNGKSLKKIFTELKHPKNELVHHIDPSINRNLKVNSDTLGAFGQSGAALGHLNNEGVKKGDIFLFFGTFNFTKEINGELEYGYSHPFHSLWGYLEVDFIIRDIEDITKIHEFKRLEKHPHFINRNLTEYKKTNSIFLGKNYGHFNFSEILRLSKIGFRKSYWQLPLSFINTKITYNNLESKIITDKNIEFISAAKGQEFVLDSNPDINKWLDEVIKCKA